MLDADGNVIDEFTSMYSSVYQHCKGGRGHSEVTGNSLVAGKASFDVKFICLNEFCPGLSENGITLNCCNLLAR